MKRVLERHPVAAVMLLTLLCVAPVMALRDFTPANELRYLSIADEAIADGHVFAFSNHGEPYADKPPLYFWIVMLCRLLFGRHSMFVLSLLSLLPAFGIVAVMDRWAYKNKNALTRAAAAAMLLTTALFLSMAVYVRMDMLMCLWIVLAIYSYWEGKIGWFGFFTFLALFTKGPVGLLVPPLSVAVYLVATGNAQNLGKTFSWKFWAVLGGLSLAWLAGAYFEGGVDYLWNLTVHQTVGRAVNSFHHQAPFWFYLVTVWGVAAPWCLLTIPGLAASFFDRKETGSRRTRRERLFAWTVVVTLVMLSLFSSKLALYLLPVLPFLTALFVRVEKRLGWCLWMRVALGVITAVFALIGLAAMAGYFFFDRLPVPVDYGFARTPLLLPAGALLLAGSIYAFRWLGREWQRPVLAISVALLLTAAVMSPLVPRVNEVIGYGQLCGEIRRAAPSGGVYAVGLVRPENMDVYLHRPVTAVDPDEWVKDPSLIPSGATVVLDETEDAAASCRYSSILRESGRHLKESSAGRYGIWF